MTYVHKFTFCLRTLFPIQIHSTLNAFVVRLPTGGIVSWGNYGGERNKFHVRDIKVESIYSTDHAFTAKMKDGTVQTWGARGHSVEEFG